MKTLVVGESQAGHVNPASFEAVAAAQAIGGAVHVVVPGAETSAACQELASADVAEVIALEHEALGAYTPDGFVAALATFIGELAPDVVVFAHTYQARDYVPRLAARLNAALVTDCTTVRQADGGLLFTRPIFGGKAVATVALDGPAPHLVTFQIGAFRRDAVRRGSAPATVRRVAASIDPSAIRQQPEAPFQEVRRTVDLSAAERVVAVGRGIKDKDHLAVAESLAKALGAELAASRPICDAGWLPMDRQVGSSGQTIAPRLYVALGISGAIQHLVGMRGSRTVVAINSDRDAPIFEVADYGIVADLFEIVPAIVKVLESTT